MRSPLTALERFVDALVAEGAASAVVALVGGPRDVLWSRAAGWARQGMAGRRADAGTCFDYGSLSKPFVATLALGLDRAGDLPLATPLGAVLPGTAPDLAAQPLAALLRHRAGLQAWTPLYARCGSLDAAQALLRSGALLGGRAGTYSDLDYLLWGWAAERALGRPLAQLVAERVLAPLGIAATTGASPATGLPVAESRMGTGREVELAARAGLTIAALPPPQVGWPQDGNARFLTRLALAGSAGGVAGAAAPGGERGGAAGAVLCGHCGLFGPAADLWRLGAEWLAPRRLLDRGMVAAALAGGGPFALGWWRRRHRGGGGPALSADSFGHSGFAGGSLWIDPARSRVFVLLAHRLDPAINLNRWRRRFHAAATRAFDLPDPAWRDGGST